VLPRHYRKRSLALGPQCLQSHWVTSRAVSKGPNSSWSTLTQSPSGEASRSQADTRPPSSIDKRHCHSLTTVVLPL
jgi:hypothetical protein